MLAMFSRPQAVKKHAKINRLSVLGGFAFLTALTLTGPVAAYEMPGGIELGVGYTAVDLGVTTSGISGRVGIPVQDNIGIEIEATKGLGWAEYYSNGYSSAEQQLDYAVAVMGTYSYDLSPGLKVTGRLGASTSKLTIKGTLMGYSSEADLSFTGVAYGTGISYDLASVPGTVRADYANYDGMGVFMLQYAVKLGQ